ncbi:hypothetical protein E2C01_008079 [Portunus trituberculatus]|uniref:Uncharacterized protein n=1 Tax=Portunus trituberculatus TaxID=210409 RepID=A0A5B7CZU8_PORTR|nr:hypothetical protein [Portunus trituberculatus]
MGNNSVWNYKRIFLYINLGVDFTSYDFMIVICEDLIHFTRLYQIVTSAAYVCLARVSAD